MSQFIQTLPTGSNPISLSLKVVSLIFLSFILISNFLSIFPLMSHFYSQTITLLRLLNVTLVFFPQSLKFSFKFKIFHTKIQNISGYLQLSSNFFSVITLKY